MDMYKLKWTSLEHRLFDLLCAKAGDKLSQRELSKMLKVSPTAVANSLDGLRDLVKVEKTKTINFVSLNRDKELVINLKRSVNLKNLYLSGLSNALAEHFPGTTIILFGSYSRGDDTVKSDIDVAIIQHKTKYVELEKYEKYLNRTINVQFYLSWKQIPTELKNNILNGIVLHGSVGL